MTPVSYLRSTGRVDRPASPRSERLRTSPRGRLPRGAATGFVAAIVVVALGAVALQSGQPTLSAYSDGLAEVGMPLGGGTITKLTATTGPHARRIPVEVRGTTIWPKSVVGANELIKLDVVVKRPGWISWLAGSTAHLRLNVLTPSAKIRETFLTLTPHAPLRLHFDPAVQVIAFGPPGHLTRLVLSGPRSAITIPHSGDAGAVAIAAAPRKWETSGARVISWFPKGSATATAVASPAPGGEIRPTGRITLTFSTTVKQALGSARPPVSPATAGYWRTTSEHSIEFVPQGYGYGLGTTVNIALPSGVRLVGGQPTGTSNVATWSVPIGSALRLQQLLADLGYLPLSFSGGNVARNPAAQEAAALAPPNGRFSWRYGHVPDSLKRFWAPGKSGVMTQGAVMAFQSEHGLNPDGTPGAALWRALIDAAIQGKRSTFGYSYVMVNRSAQELALWHSGKTLVTTAVNTGISSAPTDSGTYPVFEHIAVGTMSGTNPDGSSYSDPGIRWISYFNGGDALHAFTRAQYGSPQSLGCVEMALEPAARVWPYTPIGTLVYVT